MARLEEGDLFADRYEIKKLLGRGGMGMVYLVQDWKTRKAVALKTLLPRYAHNQRAVARFTREVNAAARLHHPCIVRIHDAGKCADTLYYTMEYVDGKSLRRWMTARGRLTFRSALRVMVMLCHALEHAHKITIHRDISPENVMAMADGSVKLLDFGLAKLTDEDAGLTRVGISLGKVQYIAPEQQLDAKNVDLRADIYALGIMFFEMLTGQLPKTGDRIEALVDDLPPGCDAIYLKATAKNPEDRYQSARALRHALKRLYEGARGEPVHAAPHTTEPAPLESAAAPQAAQSRFSSFVTRVVMAIRDGFRRALKRDG